MSQHLQDRLSIARGDLQRQIASLQESATTLEVGCIATALIDEYDNLGAIRCKSELDDDGLTLRIQLAYDLKGNDITPAIDLDDVESLIAAYRYTEDAAQRLDGHTNLREAVAAAEALLS